MEKLTLKLTASATLFFTLLFTASSLSSLGQTNIWIQKSDIGYDTLNVPEPAIRSNAVGFSIGNKGYLGTGYFYNEGIHYYKDFWEYNPDTDTWMQKADFGGPAREHAVGFSIDNKGYLGTGYAFPNYYKDFWEYDPDANTWTQKADFGGTPRYKAAGFSIGSKGYLGTGYDNNYTKDFWEYDPDADTWTQKADFGGTVRLGAVGFSIDNKGYLGTGYNFGTSYKDFWEYDPDTDIWTQKADFGGTARYDATGFSIGNKGYLGTGDDGSYKKDFWEYDPNANIWTQRADFGGTACTAAVGFSIGSKGYLGTGYYYDMKDFREYDPDANTWTKKADFGGTARHSAVGFSIGSKGYLGTGDYGFPFSNDFWEYDPDANSWTQKAEFGGNTRSGAVGFSIDSKGYLGTGNDGGYEKDFWKYDQGADNWTKKKAFEGIGRREAVGFSIGSKGYLGTGFVSGSANMKDIWEYDRDANTWTQKADFGGNGRHDAIGFTIGNKGYVGTGSDFNTYYKDFWEYDPDANSWTQKADFGGTARSSAVGFSIGSKGYLGTGMSGEYPDYIYYKDCWEYDPDVNSWTQKVDFGGTARSSAVGFTIGSKGYVGTGMSGEYPDYIYHKDFWEYTPEICIGLTVYADADADSYGDAANSFFAADCIVPGGYVYDSTDCDDSNALANPGATEICDSIDNNCDGNIDEGLLLTFYPDADGDTYGDAANSSLACSQPTGYVTNNTDCNDSNTAINPTATETCNGLDDNCNLITDEGLVTEIYFADTDNDGFGNANNIIDSCAQPTGYITDSTDCDDTNSSVNPDALEIPNNGIDDNCDGDIDEFGVGVSPVISESVFSLFPNPTNGEFIVYLQLNNELNGESRIEVINMLGQIVHNKTGTVVKGKLHEEIKLNDKPDGTYMIRVIVKDRVYARQIVFERK